MLNNLDLNVQKKIETWLSGSIDEETKSEIRSLIDQNDVDALTDAFYKDFRIRNWGFEGHNGCRFK